MISTENNSNLFIHQDYHLGTLTVQQDMAIAKKVASEAWGNEEVECEILFLRSISFFFPKLALAHQANGYDIYDVK